MWIYKFTCGTNKNVEPQNICFGLWVNLLFESKKNCDSAIILANSCKIIFYTVY